MIGTRGCRKYYTYSLAPSLFSSSCSVAEKAENGFENQLTECSSKILPPRLNENTRTMHFGES